ncbi:ankyrin repeat domain-containing protein [Endozoicomonas sp. SCSIO W0465]|uniref:ankyrin repeat domain-containing protein n=1 Tax=Endozoicomonas sp. SCSIO W0465 TaxID=2918516 RepID=UPI002075984D|nr:ankyrin repeat domain-containing protein [Endozoicomonas sp. SCSIO W0465]USE35036.1 ankyrin repeat domain-containing protein [Endozoicomonas sp. SCSIO W0465]
MNDSLAEMALAAATYNYVKVNALLDNGDHPDLPWFGCSALNFAAQNDDAKMVNTLLAAGADPDGTSLMVGKTPLLLAVAFHNTGMMNSLLANGAQPNIPDIFGTTPLKYAAAQGYHGILKTLLDFGARPSQSDLAVAGAKGHLDILNTLTNHIPPPQQPSSLLGLCRASIRHRLVELLTERRQPLKSAVESLPLPDSIKSYVYHPLSL